MQTYEELVFLEMLKFTLRLNYWWPSPAELRKSSQRALKDPVIYKYIVNQSCAQIMSCDLGIIICPLFYQFSDNTAVVITSGQLLSCYDVISASDADQTLQM